MESLTITKAIEEKANEVCELRNTLMGIAAPSWRIMKTQQKLYQAQRCLDALQAAKKELDNPNSRFVGNYQTQLLKARAIDALCNRQRNVNWSAFLVAVGLSLLLLIYFIANLKHLNLI